ncbi:phosphatidylinositol N-acetylglucosaminyltransferase subunit Q [Eurytemora carolleeae]|uniref:phosphatidylinositol N-acetylglucosaminyltransferase subunit Q n=1 Tax=Eurytemora carolleeae TaxID=1294199 RepID=UPI000C763840|nr:phosphatidylinositol N-acetylglucosaminyltransferase subunit Q [Eurytemora carolleeae]|eukprot:XP_023330022.1 phosphatidylinositol N-acetylglucosaminyltransferase subunit Q-like [Eurytemora affinis]
MQNPGGLKLNSVLSQALGNFFLYHIHLWVTYVYMIVPTLVSWFYFFSPAFKFLPLTLQISCLGDLLTLVCVHVFCFYAYARRITRSQISGLIALARLFAGKKYNPLRKRVDSADVTVEHLFLGTLVFTILLFLLPTSLTFFAVFFSLRMGAVAGQQVIRSAVYILQWTPQSHEAMKI